MARHGFLLVWGTGPGQMSAGVIQDRGNMRAGTFDSRNKQGDFVDDETQRIQTIAAKPFKGTAATVALSATAFKAGPFVAPSVRDRPKMVGAIPAVPPVSNRHRIDCVPARMRDGARAP